MLAVIAVSVSGCASFRDGSPSNIVVAASNGPAMADGSTASPPPGFVGFCMHNPAACTNRAAGPTEVALDDNIKGILLRVNSRVNDAITYETDMEQFGVANRWSLDAAEGYGDCKAYALAKRQALVVAGLPEGALRIAIVRTPQDELHAVLTVDTNAGNLVLDSLTSDIRPWSQTDYVWLLRQSSDDPLRWVTLAETQNSQSESEPNLIGKILAH
jgi:predicted transglutaminase-like cysteine proteinase